MMMKALQTQFDDKRLSNAVATPTCSSCCCCCCCLATSISTSSLLTQRVVKDVKAKHIVFPDLLPFIAFFFMPIVGLIVYFGYWTIDKLTQVCAQHTINDVYGNQTYTSCSSSSGYAIAPLVVIVPIFVLWYLYRRIKYDRPFLRALLIAAIIGAAFTTEFAAGAFLVLTGVGGIVYLIAVPFLVTAISKWYQQHLSKEATYQKAMSFQPTAFSEQQSIKSPAAERYEPPEPPQQSPPASSTQ